MTDRQTDTIFSPCRKNVQVNNVFNKLQAFSLRNRYGIKTEIKKKIKNLIKKNKQKI